MVIDVHASRLGLEDAASSLRASRAGATLEPSVGCFLQDQRTDSEGPFCHRTAQGLALQESAQTLHPKPSAVWWLTLPKLGQYHTHMQRQTRAAGRQCHGSSCPVPLRRRRTYCMPGSTFTDLPSSLPSTATHAPPAYLLA